ncbi:hypothetical protein ACHAXS_006181 [Conticribra weissflogii]
MESGNAILIVSSRISKLFMAPQKCCDLINVVIWPYVTKASSTVRAALKEPAKSKAMAQEAFAYNRSHWVDGQQGVKSMVDGLKAVGK